MLLGWTRDLLTPLFAGTYNRQNALSPYSRRFFVAYLLRLPVRLPDAR